MTLAYRVDEALCCGHGQCYAVAPEVFTADGDGFNAAVGRTVEIGPDLASAARDGAAACPEQAVQFV